VPNLLWLVLLGGAAITIGFTFFFGTESLLAQVLMTALPAILILSELLIIVGIDRPFSGAVKVGPNALAAVFADIESRSSDSSSLRIEPEQKELPGPAAVSDNLAQFGRFGPATALSIWHGTCWWYR